MTTSQARSSNLLTLFTCKRVSAPLKAPPPAHPVHPPHSLVRSRAPAQEFPSVGGSARREGGERRSARRAPRSLAPRRLHAMAALKDAVQAVDAFKKVWGTRAG